jgi:hypothetical protein
MNAPPVLAGDGHARALLAARRCPWCAERLPAAVALRGGACGACAREAHADGSADRAAVLDALNRRWRTWRWPVYAAFTAAQLLAGLVPLLPAVLTFAAVVFLRVFLMRRSMAWLSPLRRIATRLGLRLAGATVAVADLMISVLLIPFPGVASIVGAFAALILLVLWAEGGMAWVRNRLRRESAGPGLDVAEWLIPALLAALLFGTAAAIAGSAGAILYALANLPVPGISDLASWFLSPTGEP